MKIVRHVSCAWSSVHLKLLAFRECFVAKFVVQCRVVQLNLIMRDKAVIGRRSFVIVSLAGKVGKRGQIRL